MEDRSDYFKLVSTKSLENYIRRINRNPADTFILYLAYENQFWVYPINAHLQTSLSGDGIYSAFFAVVSPQGISTLHPKLIKYRLMDHGFFSIDDLEMVPGWRNNIYVYGLRATVEDIATDEINTIVQDSTYIEYSDSDELQIWRMPILNSIDPMIERKIDSVAAAIDKEPLENLKKTKSIPSSLSCYFDTQEIIGYTKDSNPKEFFVDMFLGYETENEVGLAQIKQDTRKIEGIVRDCLASKNADYLINLNNREVIRDELLRSIQYLNSNVLQLSFFRFEVSELS
jgi:flagellar basal body-associated protein FliL